MTNKSVACIILNYNDYETTSSLVNKIKDYNNINYIIIVDNYSTDDSYEKLKDFQNNHIFLINSNKNGGYGFGNNCGLKYAINTLKCDYCLIANPDVIFEEIVVTRLIDFLDKNDDYAVVAPYQHGTKKQAWKKTGVLRDQLFYSIFFNKLCGPRYYPDKYFENPVCDVYAVKGCFLAFRSSAISKIGFYDEDFFLYEEEKVIAYKLEKYNYKSAVLTDVDYIHNHSVTIKKNLKKYGQGKRIVLKSNELYLKKYMGIGNIRMHIIKFYHAICVFESIIYEWALSVSKR